MATETTVSELPRCDFAPTSAWPNYGPCEGPARYDFKTKGGPWANGCERHYRAYRAFRELGTGKGQRLVVAK